MARGFDKHYARQAAIAGLGRALSRRARNACELCHEATSLVVVEVPPLEESPEPDRAVLVCGRCAGAIQDTHAQGRPETLRFLTDTVWSDVPAVQIAVVRVLRRLAEDGQGWAGDVLDGLYLDPEIEAVV